MTALPDFAFRDLVRSALADHPPASKDYATNTKTCLCGHQVAIGDMAARTQHLEDVITARLVAHAELLRKALES